MTGILILCAIGATFGIIILGAMAAFRIRRAWRDGVWSRAYRLAVEQPDVVAQVAADVGFDRHEPPAAVIDAMGHTDLVDRVLADEQERLELKAELEDTITGSHAILDAARAAYEAELERERRSRAAYKGHITRLRRQASNPEGATS